MAKVIVEFMLFFVASAPKMAFQSPSGMHGMGKRGDVCSCSMRSPAACRDQDEQVTSWLTFPDFNRANIPPGGAAAAADTVIAKTRRHGVKTISPASLLHTTNKTVATACVYREVPQWRQVHSLSRRSWVGQYVTMNHHKLLSDVYLTDPYGGGRKWRWRQSRTSVGVPFSARYRFSALKCSCVVGETGRVSTFSIWNQRRVYRV
jgi:hypothetical protein